MSGAGWSSARRFYKTASVEEGEQGFALRLDARSARTPAKNLLAAPTRAAADALAAEWEAQGETIDPGSMPITRALNSAIDRVTAHHGAVVDDLAGYGETDLLCHRAPHPEGLIARQAALWDPPLDWARRRYAAPLICATGVMHVAQPAESLARLRAVVAAHDPFRLTALYDLVAISGSLVLGLGVAEGAFTPDEAWTASRVDEEWQIAQWGEDAEAAAFAARKRASFLDAARLMRLLGQQEG